MLGYKSTAIIRPRDVYAFTAGTCNMFLEQCTLCLLTETLTVFNNAQGMWHFKMILKYWFERVSNY
jgi:hypothetical protein